MGREGSCRAPARPLVDHPGPSGWRSSARGAPSQRRAIGGAGRAGRGAPRRAAADGGRMKQLWAPWRLAFIEQVSHGSGCIFCEKPANHQDGKTFILWRGRHAFVLMNIYPYNNGHLLIAPYRHIGALEDLPETVLLDMLRLVQRSIKAIRKAYAPEGFNIGVNQGKVAGAGIEHHIHLHIGRRWSSDTNFIPLLGETRVLPQHLRASYTRLKAAFNSGRSSSADRRRARPTRRARQS